MTNSYRILNDFFAQCESKELVVDLSLVNDFSRFRKILYSSKFFSTIVDEIKFSNVNLADVVFDRIKTLSDVENNPLALHRYDVAIASYLLLLERANQQKAMDAFLFVKGKNFQNLWWANFSLAYIKTKSSKTEDITRSYLGLEDESSSDISDKTRSEASGTTTLKILNNNICYSI